eukprot:2742654-Prymnesium_polylepis.1
MRRESAKIRTYPRRHSFTSTRSRVVGSLRASIAFVIAVLPLLPVRRLCLRDILRAAARPPVVAWSDAMWEAEAQ